MPEVEIVPGESLAGIAIGATEDEVTRALGLPEDISEFDEEDVQFYSYQSLGLSFRFEHGLLATGFAYSGRKGGYETGEFARYDGKTPEGVDMDSSYSEVLRIYGRPSYSGQLSLAPVPSRWIVYHERGVGFDFIVETDEMITINVSHRRNGDDALDEAGDADPG